MTVAVVQDLELKKIKKKNQYTYVYIIKSINKINKQDRKKLPFQDSVAQVKVQGAQSAQVS